MKIEENKNNIIIETIRCPLCGSNDYKIFDKENNWVIVECRNCSFRYTNPRPKVEALSSFYSEEYFKNERHYKSFYNPDGTIKQDPGTYINRIFDIETHVTKRGKLLEIGAARGAFLFQAQKRGWDVEGIEISIDAVNLAKELYKLNIYNGTLEDFTTASKYDVICMYQTLEHLPDPQFIVKRSFELLNNDGIIVIEVPNIQSIENKLSRRLKHERYDLPRHLNHFSPHTLEQLLKKEGYEVAYCDNYPPLLWTNFFKNLIYVKNRMSKFGEGITAGEIIENNPPLLKANKPTVRQKMLREFSEWFPGWRVTIIGKKI